MEKHQADLRFGGHWYWDWADDFLPVASIDDDHVVTMGRHHHYGIGKHIRLRAFNLVEEIDQAGEYAIEPAHRRIVVLLAPDQTGDLVLS